MRLLFLHNRYQLAGGEDVVVRAERDLLVEHGHEVDLLEADNAEIKGVAGKLKAGLDAVYSAGSRDKVADRIRQFQPDVVHLHNFFPLLSPSVYYACREGAVPVVQTLHNYRVICPNALLLRSGRPCEDCVRKRFAWPGILHACYRGSRLGTASVATMTGAHKLLGTWRNRVNLFIALSDFAKTKLAEGGLPEEKIVVKPNFVPDPVRLSDGRGDFALFVGRLSPEKGIGTLLSAWERAKSQLLLKVVGDGPLGAEVARHAAEGRIQCLGAQPHEKVLELMREATLLVFPSVWYEGFPMVIVEAFSVGLPVVASGLGTMSSLVAHGRTGLHFTPGDPEDLNAKVNWAWSHRVELAEMGRAARAEYESKYTPERNYELLMKIYLQACGAERITAVVPA